MRALRDKETGIIYPILEPEDHKGGPDGYEYNRPSPKWELVKVPKDIVELNGGHEQVWKGNNLDFVEEIEI